MGTNTSKRVVPVKDYICNTCNKKTLNLTLNECQHLYICIDCYSKVKKCDKCDINQFIGYK